MLVNVTIPVFNEEAQAAESVRQVNSFLESQSRFDFEIVVVNNGSTDRTQEIVESLQGEYPRLRSIFLPEKGRGHALKRAWSESKADILSYMDVDLSTDLAAFPALIRAVANGGFDLATGSRLLKLSEITRCWRRELISRCYNRLVKAVFDTRFSDAQCGFKAITRRAAVELLPVAEDNGWFFDTELLVLAEKRGYRICDVPVRWIEDRDSRVKIFRTALDDLKGILRLRRNLANAGGKCPQPAHTNANKTGKNSHAVGC